MCIIFLMNKISNNARRCPLCDCRESEVLYVQNFADYFRHAIACCRSCGFVFVNNIPSQSFYNKYYRDMSKYEHDRDYKLHEDSNDIIKQYCPPKAKILDVGCSTGHLLYLLKKQGFKKIEGIDPSPECKRAALAQFGLNITTASINAFKPRQKYDFIILSAVLEHIHEVADCLKKTDSWLSDDGSIFISVPDAENFYKNFEEPFGEFSTEHINFFSQASLYRAMPNYTRAYMRSDDSVIYSIWQKGGELKKSVNKYISLSDKKFIAINQVIMSLPSEVIVWGAGSLTQRLLVSTQLSKKAIKLTDRNNFLHGTQLNGIEIINPSEMKKYKQPIFICSFRFKNEIIKEIKKRRLRNKVIHF